MALGELFGLLVMLAALFGMSAVLTRRGGLSSAAAPLAALALTELVLLAAGLLGILRPAGFVLAALGAKLYRFGVFLTAWIAVGAVFQYVIRPSDWMWTAGCAAAGLIFGLFAIKFVKAVTLLNRHFLSKNGRLFVSAYHFFTNFRLI